MPTPLTETFDVKQAEPRAGYPEVSRAPAVVAAKPTPQADHGEDTYVGLGRLTDKTAVITGAGSGIGRAVAIAFAREGADVLISYLPNEESDAAETAKWVQREGRRAIPMPGDIQDETHCARIIDRAFDKFGRLDILVNNAGFLRSQHRIEEFSTADFDHTLRTTIYAMFWLCRAALPRMTPGAAIINTASIQACDQGGSLLACAAATGAIVNFTKALSELAMPRRVRVNAVAPGPMWTPQTLFERAAHPVEVASLFVFLASSEARSVTGEVYGATGIT